MDTLSRRRLLKCTVGTAALAGAMAVGLPMPAAGASVVGSAAGGKPGRHVRDILPTVSSDAIALTIDDGPDPLWTPQILDLLRRNAADPATLDEAVRLGYPLALISCTPSGLGDLPAAQAVLLRHDPDGWHVVAGWPYPPQAAERRWQHMLSWAPLCRAE